MLIAFVSFFLGVFFAPLVRPLMRPFAAEVMKLFVTATYEVRSAAARAKEEIEDAIATAEAERAAKQSAAPPSDAHADSTKTEPSKSSADGV